MRVAVIGASGGIGQALCCAFANQKPTHQLYAVSRSGDVLKGTGITPLRLDLQDEGSISAAAEQIKSDGPLDMVLVATGLLTDQTRGITPEKTLRHQSAEAFAHVFAVNTFGPALIAKHFLPLLARKQRVVFAALSARVGSISDNRLGGWHAYRASKAALNMLIKTYALEIGRQNDQAVIVGLHPGTVATALSADFTGSSSGRTVFSADQSALYLLDVLAGLKAKDSGKVFDWAGKEIPA